ncbi:hypothetical protein [Gordonia effusa]|uniref:hypothetical protein n=1 Tax=Gordonia effusa TaxID=263908 RepID=UPI00059098AA|nr:hypothetical protein [Gordonia effusa]
MTHTKSATTCTESTAVHEHGWYTQSRHATSEGVVLYVRCGSCGTQRVDLQRPDDLLPAAISGEI